ncbi:MAG: transcription-repair coupling factor [Desulfobacteraceae bacterium]
MFRQLKQFIHERNSAVSIPGTGGEKTAYTAAGLYYLSDRPFVIILPDQGEALKFADRFRFFLPEKHDEVIFFPSYNILPFKSLSYHGKTAASRVNALYRLISPGSGNPVVITSIDTLLQKVIPKEKLSGFAEPVEAGEEIDRAGLISKLDEYGYTRTSLVEDVGEYAVRGGIIDYFTPLDDNPVRVELFGDMAESLRTFSPVSQRGIGEIRESTIIPAGEAVIEQKYIAHILGRLRQEGKRAGIDSAVVREHVEEIREKGRFAGIDSMLSIVYPELDTLFDYFPEDALFMVDSPELQREKAEEFEEQALKNFENVKSKSRLCVNPDTIYTPYDTVLEKLGGQKPVYFRTLGLSGHSEPAAVYDTGTVFADNTELVAELRTADRSENLLKPLADWVVKKRDSGFCVNLVTGGRGGKERIARLLGPYGLEPAEPKAQGFFTRSKAGVFSMTGPLDSGFLDKENRLAFVTETEIFGPKRTRPRNRSKRDVKSEFIAPEELKTGDIVVHMEHGIGRYEGLTTISVDNIRQDFVLITYQDDDRLYLPVDRMEVIEKYVGVEGYTPILDKIGGKTWEKSKAKARQEVEKLAGDLLNLYAERKVQDGFSFSRPDSFFNDFESSFPYEETPDQQQAIDDVLLDMERSVPMDRLVCGDVGYGKTEVALRAAFKAVNDGKQVAVVVPTTLLAEQHLKTFTERFEGYPVTVAGLSRFKSRKEQNDILRRLESGTLDVVIGTHRLLQKDVAFHSLGLLVIDEEQRFGVKHKERIKQKRSTVDVLALTATPIPRTLHLSLTGLRDISVINTPPEDRQPIVSYICENDDTIIADAVRKELERGGQVFFVHNNIKSIFKKSEKLKELVPEARIDVAHGRLSESVLEEVMLKFIRKSIDVLVCTTIVESGLDIPSANTMIINNAERFGLSQIYQLRGRIGRGDDQAYAYLFVSDESRLTRDAAKRLAALMEHRDLGSGFQIAMKDLQIRGSGSALGASQSGHIASVGYDMFLKLLDSAIRDMKGDEVEEPLEPEINIAMSAYIPDEYVSSVEQRLTVYRRLSKVNSLSGISGMKQELIDRFGKLPREAENMLLKIMLRVLAIKSGVERLDLSFNQLTLAFSAKHISDFGRVESVLNRQGLEYTLPRKNTVNILLGKKRKNIAKSLVESKQILSELARGFSE